MPEVTHTLPHLTILSRSINKSGWRRLAGDDDSDNDDGGGDGNDGSDDDVLVGCDADEYSFI